MATEDAKKHSDLQSGSRPSQDERRGPPRNCAFSADGAQDLAVESTVVAGHTAWAHLGCLPSLATRLKRDVNVNTYFKTRFAAYCIYFENIQSTSNLHPIYIQSTSNLHPIYIQSTSNLHPIYLSGVAVFVLYWIFTEFLLNVYSFFFWRNRQAMWSLRALSCDDHISFSCALLRDLLRYEFGHRHLMFGSTVLWLLLFVFLEILQVLADGPLSEGHLLGVLLRESRLTTPTGTSQIYAGGRYEAQKETWESRMSWASTKLLVHVVSFLFYELTGQVIDPQLTWMLGRLQTCSNFK